MFPITIAVAVQRPISRFSSGRSRETGRARCASWLPSSLLGRPFVSLHLHARSRLGRRRGDRPVRCGTSDGVSAHRVGLGLRWHRRGEVTNRCWATGTRCSRLERRVDELMRSFFGTRTTIGRRAFVPPIDVYERKGDLVVRTELPGLDAVKDVKVRVEDGALVITGERRQKEEVDEKRLLPDGDVVRRVHAAHRRCPKGSTRTRSRPTTRRACSRSWCRRRRRRSRLRR